MQDTTQDTGAVPAPCPDCGESRGLHTSYGGLAHMREVVPEHVWPFFTDTGGLTGLAVCGECYERYSMEWRRLHPPPTLRLVEPDEEPEEEPPQRSSWAPVDLEPILAGRETDPPPTMLLRDDGRALVYPGKVHAFHGEPESGKSWVLLCLAAEQLRAGHRVLYVDFEDTPASVVGRLRSLGVSNEDIRLGFRYISPQDPLGPATTRDLDAAAQGIVLAVIDGVTEGMTLHGWELKDNGDIAKWLAALPRRLVRTGAAVAQIDHVAKDKNGRGRWALGGQHKLAGVDCAYAVEAVTPLGRGRTGRLRIAVEKDRPGHVRGYANGKRVADILAESDDTGAMTMTVQAPDVPAKGEPFRPTYLMERVSRAVEQQPGLSTRVLRETVTGNSKAKALALELLIAEHFVDARKEGAQAVRHYSFKPYREVLEHAEQDQP
jgi:hypothetical protein